jgi:hypothetical protein
VGATGLGAAGADFATGIGGAGFTTWGAGLATGATGRATGPVVLFTGTDTLLTAGAGFPFSVCALADADITVAAISSGTKIFFMISLLYGEDIKNYEQQKNYHPYLYFIISMWFMVVSLFFNEV